MNNLGPTGSIRCNSAHKAAISLNNAAVSLLVRGWCSEALETFDDAIQVMDVATQISNNGIPNMLRESVLLALDRSSKRTSLCSTLTAVVGNNPNNNAGMSRLGYPDLMVISSQCNPARVFERLTSCNDTASLRVAFPMTIDPFDSLTSEDSRTTEHVSFEIGVVLHNYGVAYDCVAAQLQAGVCAMPPLAAPSQTISTTTLPSSLLGMSSSRVDCATTPFQGSSELPSLSPLTVTNSPLLCDLYARRTMIQTKAFHLFQWSSALLARVDLESHDILPACLASQLLLLRTVVTHNLINDSIALHLDYEYHEYCAIMQSLLHLVEAQHLLLPINEHFLAAAA